MLAGNPETGVGIGRAIPIYRQGHAGGTRCLKLLWDKGFENFPCYSDEQERRPFGAFLFGFDNGFEQAVIYGRQLVDRLVEDSDDP